MRYEHTESRKNGEWMDIETAPKDGSRFLAWTVTKVGKYDGRDIVQCYVAVAYFVCGGFVIESCGSFVPNMEITHWQLLPLEPKK